MRLEHHLVGGYVRYISPHIIIIIIIIPSVLLSGTDFIELLTRSICRADYQPNLRIR